MKCELVKTTRLCKRFSRYWNLLLKEVGDLKEELQNVLDNNIQNGGEYQINDGIKA
jgi:hypothetical protein